MSEFSANIFLIRTTSNYFWADKNCAHRVLQKLKFSKNVNNKCALKRIVFNENQILKNLNNVRLMLIPAASSKIFWPCSNFFDRVQYFLKTFNFFLPWSKVIFYFINLHIWAWSEIFDHTKKILNVVKKFWMQPNNFLN